MSFKLIVLMIASLAIFYKNQAQTTDSIDNECSTEVEDIDLGKIIILIKFGTFNNGFGI
jgi:hypothetical protein